jgi:hypothetical protein
MVLKQKHKNMLIKTILQFFKDKGYKIVEDDINTRVTCIDLKSSIIITHTVTGRTMIAYKSDNDIRFVGLIENLPQLKLVLKLTSELPVK